MMNKLLKFTAAVPIFVGTVAGLTANANAADLTGCVSGAPLCSGSINFDYTVDPLILSVDGQTADDIGGPLGTPVGFHFGDDTLGVSITSDTFNDVNEVEASDPTLQGSIFDGASDWKAFLRDFALTDAKNQITGLPVAGTSPATGVTDGNYLVAFTSATANGTGKEYLISFDEASLANGTSVTVGGTGAAISVINVQGTILDVGTGDTATAVLDLTLQGINGTEVSGTVNSFYAPETSADFNSPVFANNGFSGNDNATAFAPSDPRTLSATLNFEIVQDIDVPEPNISLALFAVGSLGLFGKALKRRSF